MEARRRSRPDRQRLEAKRAKNWAEADAIRDQLRAMGVEIKDGKDGTTWTRI